MVNRIKKIRYLDEKKRFLIFVVGLFLMLFLSFYLFKTAYAKYEIRAKVNANINKALYIFEDQKMAFNLESTGIVPRDDPYTYTFSVSNFNANKHSDVDLNYQVKVRTTTNLPITISLYRNELPTASGATNLFQSSTTGQDEDGAWYRLYDANCDFEMDYTDNVTDVYTLVISFPASYAIDSTYANYLESIEIILESQQII